MNSSTIYGKTSCVLTDGQIKCKCQNLPILLKFWIDVGNDVQQAKALYECGCKVPYPYLYGGWFF